MIRATVGIFAGSAGGFDANYQAVLDYATTQAYTLPSESQQALQNQLVVDLKDAGVWSKLDVLYVFATDGDEDFACINWKDPNNHEATQVNSPTFTTNKGFESNLTSSYLNTNYNMSTDAVNYSQNDAGFCTFISDYNNVSGDIRIMGHLTESNYMSIRTNGERFWLNSGSYTQIHDYNLDNQFFFGVRTGASTASARTTDAVNGLTTNTSILNTSTTLPNSDVTILRTQNQYSINLIPSLIAYGSNFSSSEMDDIETAWYTNYYTSL